ncbi:polysaccharide deacetylase family protein [Coraliomargarita parva]|uniref:polysaccharide deacetylase family protein n=1 Tax=Coraliomargarita parva TaxID=3014050 RepID=UPI0022B4B513|nr:polysaccharide deacetylase family protein [Coraliomargarita parva]
MKKKLIPIHAILLLTLSITDLQAVDAPVIPMCEQELVIVGDAVEVEIAPIHNDKAWAFTARWDDNHKINPEMRDAMARIGMRGTFYLNRSEAESGAGTEYALALTQEGCSIGGHTSEHYSLPTLNPNALFREILLNRIEREAEIDTPITSFAFPFGHYAAPEEPEAMERVTDAWLRSGYHHNVYHNFVYNNPFMPAGYASSGHQVKPGDFKIDAQNFEKQISRILDNPQKYQQQDAVISLGAHARQSTEEMEKFEALIANYTKRDDFWNANETEVASYRFQSKHTTLTPDTKTQGTYHIVRPRASYAGNDISLTLRLTGPKPQKVILDGKELKIQPNDGNWLVNLPYSPKQCAPEKITWLQNGPGEKHPTPDSDFPGLNFLLELTTDSGWSLSLINNSDETIRNIQVILRLPAYYQDGVRLIEVPKLQKGEKQNLRFEQGPVQDNPIYRDGAIFAAAEVDFLYRNQPGRIYATYLGAPVIRLSEDVRDASVAIGPLPHNIETIQKLLPFSIPDAPLSPLTNSPLDQWRTVNDDIRADFATNRFVVYNQDLEWRKAARSYEGKSAFVVVVCDISLLQSGPLKIKSGLTLASIGIDGHDTPLKDGMTADISAGSHRLILFFEKNIRGAYHKVMPTYLKLTVHEEPVDYLLTKQLPHESI